MNYWSIAFSTALFKIKVIHIYIKTIKRYVKKRRIKETDTRIDTRILS